MQRGVNMSNESQSPIPVYCSSCGRRFLVAAIVDWHYAEQCDNCILRAQPWGNPDRMEEELDFIEREKEAYLERQT